jgi:hypothetical protein
VSSFGISGPVLHIGPKPGSFEDFSSLPWLIFFSHPADHFPGMVVDDLTQLELMLNRFRRLLNDIIRGTTARNSFEPWEIAILLDLEQCPVLPRRRLDILRQYEKAVARQMETGPGPPMKLSEFLQLRMTRRPSTR